MTRLFGLETKSSIIEIPLDDVALEGQLCLPDGARAVVVFAQGRGSCRTNAVDTFLAAQLQHAGYATLLADLYTPAELQEDIEDAHVRFNVRMLAHRLTGITDYLVHHASTHHMVTAFLGGSTGGAAALIVAANRPETVGAIVCRSARPDLAGNSLKYVHAPTLLLVGENDTLLLSLNERAADQLPYTHKLITIPNAGQNFQEAGVLEQFAVHALQWFSAYLTPNRAV